MDAVSFLLLEVRQYFLLMEEHDFFPREFMENLHMPWPWTLGCLQRRPLHTFLTLSTWLTESWILERCG